MNAHLDRLPVLVVNPHSLCNCRCAMCDIWKRTQADEIGPALFDRQLEDMEKLGVEWVVFSGGEALLHADLFRKAAELRRRGIKITLLSSGLLLARHAANITAVFDEVIVSLDGPRAVHDLIRGVARAFDLMATGIRKLRAERPGFPVSGRSTIQRGNCAHLMETIAAARTLGLDSISFLAADIHSTAFNRQPLPLIDGLNIVAPRPRELVALDAQLELVIESGLCGGYVRESPEKLRKIAHHFRCCLGEAVPVAPLCNAPWTSAVIEADGKVRPCFFHAPLGTLGEGAGLAEVLNGPAAVAFREQLNIETDPVCRKCVCSLNYHG
ncbi:MAG: radical SAM protein [Acidobacteriota bacterium]